MNRTTRMARKICYLSRRTASRRCTPHRDVLHYWSLSLSPFNLFRLSFFLSPNDGAKMRPRPMFNYTVHLSAMLVTQGSPDIDDNQRVACAIVLGSSCINSGLTGDTVWVKKNPPLAFFWHFFPNGWEFVIYFVHTYYTFISTLDYKFLFNYLQFWRSYAILSETAHPSVWHFTRT